MKIFLFTVFVFSLVLGGYALAEVWYQIDADEKYVADFVLGSGQEKEITVDSSKTLEVGFRDDVVGFDQYKEMQAKYGVDVVKLLNVHSGNSLSSIVGGAFEVKPVDGKLRVTVKNLIDKELKVMVYTKEVTE